MDDPYTDLIEELARVRAEAVGWRRKAAAYQIQVRTWRGRAIASVQYSRVALLTRLIGTLQDEIEARDTVLRVVEEARG